MASRCRLCTCNDRDTLILSMAQDLWTSVAPHEPMTMTWDKADYWRPIYLSLATRAVESLERERQVALLHERAA